MRWTLAADSVPTRIAAIAPDGTAASRNTAATNWVMINQRPKWRNGRLRCGDEVERAAVEITAAAGGNTGGPSTSKSRLMTLRSSSTTKAAISAVSALAAPMARRM
jgi:hypothetical protein